MEELDNILKGDPEAAKPEEAQKKALEEKSEEDKKLEEEVLKKQEQKANLDIAIAKANEELKTLREAKKKAKTEEDEIPKIDFDDPSSKAWDRHIKESFTPVQAELDKEKEEIRNFALKEFLADKPNLAKNPEKLKEMIGVYERIKTASERTKEGVLNDLNRAFAAVYSDELITSARESRVKKAQGEALFADAGVSRGSTAYFKEREADPSQDLSDDDRVVLAKWGMTPSEWGEAKKKYQ